MAEEFEDALASVSHTMVGSIEGEALGTIHERITRIELDLSDGRVIELTVDTDIDHRPELLLDEIVRKT